MDMECYIVQMEIYMKENLKKEKWMEILKLFMAMEKFIKEYLLKDNLSNNYLKLEFSF